MKRIFIIEDTPDAREMLRELLTLEGYEVITAVNGKDALAKFYLYESDLIITDLQMPKMDGLTFIKKIRTIEKLSAIPIIVFSANASPENEKKCIAAGASKFLKKPCPTEKLLESINTVMTITK